MDRRNRAGRRLFDGILDGLLHFQGYVGNTAAIADDQADRQFDAPAVDRDVDAAARKGTPQLFRCHFGDIRPQISDIGRLGRRQSRNRGNDALGNMDTPPFIYFSRFHGNHPFSPQKGLSHVRSPFDTLC